MCRIHIYVPHPYLCAAIYVPHSYPCAVGISLSDCRVTYSCVWLIHVVGHDSRDIWDKSLTGTCGHLIPLLNWNWDRSSQPHPHTDTHTRERDARKWGGGDGRSNLFSKHTVTHLRWNLYIQRLGMYVGYVCVCGIYVSTTCICVSMRVYNTPTHACTHARTHTNTRVNARMHTLAHTHTRWGSQVYMCVQRTYAHAHTHTHTHTHTQWKHIHARTHTHTYTHAHLMEIPTAYVSATYVHTHTHTHTHMHTRWGSQSTLVSSTLIFMPPSVLPLSEVGFFLCKSMARCIHTCEITHSYVRHDFICVTWFHMCAVTSYVWHDFICVTLAIHLCDMTYSYKTGLVH